jgi:hypothetical protein
VKIVTPVGTIHTLDIVIYTLLRAGYYLIPAGPWSLPG